MSHSYEDTFPTTLRPAEPGGDSGASTAQDRTMPTSAPDVVERVAQGAHKTVDRLAESAAPQVQRLQEGMTAALDRGGELRESLRESVRENPLAALALAVGAGMLIGRVLR